MNTTRNYTESAATASPPADPSAPQHFVRVSARVTCAHESAIRQGDLPRYISASLIVRDDFSVVDPDVMSPIDRVDRELRQAMGTSRTVHASEPLPQYERHTQTAIEKDGPYEPFTLGDMERRLGGIVKETGCTTCASAEGLKIEDVRFSVGEITSTGPLYNDVRYCETISGYSEFEVPKIIARGGRDIRVSEESTNMVKILRDIIYQKYGGGCLRGHLPSEISWVKADENYQPSVELHLGKHKVVASTWAISSERLESGERTFLTQTLRFLDHTGRVSDWRPVEIKWREGDSIVVEDDSVVTDREVQAVRDLIASYSESQAGPNPTSEVIDLDSMRQEEEDTPPRSKRVRRK